MNVCKLFKCFIYLYHVKSFPVSLSYSLFHFSFVENWISRFLLPKLKYIWRSSNIQKKISPISIHSQLLRQKQQQVKPKISNKISLTQRTTTLGTKWINFSIKLYCDSKTDQQTCLPLRIPILFLHFSLSYV